MASSSAPISSLSDAQLVCAQCGLIIVADGPKDRWEPYVYRRVAAGKVTVHERCAPAWDREKPPVPIPPRRPVINRQHRPGKGNPWPNCTCEHTRASHRLKRDFCLAIGCECNGYQAGRVKP